MWISSKISAKIFSDSTKTRGKEAKISFNRSGQKFNSKVRWSTSTIGSVSHVSGWLSRSRLLGRNWPCRWSLRTCINSWKFITVLYNSRIRTRERRIGIIGKPFGNENEPADNLPDLPEVTGHSGDPSRGLRVRLPIRPARTNVPERFWIVGHHFERAAQHELRCRGHLRDTNEEPGPTVRTELRNVPDDERYSRNTRWHLLHGLINNSTSFTAQILYPR